MRSESDSSFVSLWVWEDVTKMADKLDLSPPQLPRKWQPPRRIDEGVDSHAFPDCITYNRVETWYAFLDRSKTDFRNRTLNTLSTLRSFYCMLQKDFQSVVFWRSLCSFMTTLMSNSLTLNNRFSTALLLSTTRNTYRLSLVLPSSCRQFLELKFFWARFADWPNCFWLYLCLQGRQNAAFHLWDGWNHIWDQSWVSGD